MIVLDFLFYFLWRWFIRRKVKKVNLIPDRRACYALGLSLLMWISLTDIIIESKLYHNHHLKFPSIILVIIGYSLISLMRNKYVTKSGKDKIDPLKFNVSENVGIAIAISYFILSFVIPLIIALNLSPVKS